MKRSRKLATVIGSAALAAVAINFQAPTADASDHIDGTISGDSPADIGDFYAWNDGDNVIAVITFNGGLEAGDEPVYDADVLYTVHIDNTADAGNATDFTANTNDNMSDIQIQARFGMNGNEEWGMQVFNLPGADEALIGPVGDDLGSEGARAYAGMFDDPFFFDLTGFLETVANLQDPDGPEPDGADLAFASLDPDGDGPVDGLEGTNTMAIVFEFSGELAADGNADNFIQMWATTGRVPR